VEVPSSTLERQAQDNKGNNRVSQLMTIEENEFTEYALYS
jgi:hypothetical protein